MTVGIAAIADRDKAIILATDQMMSVGVLTADFNTIVKSFRFHNRWAALWAGNVTLVPPIMRKATSELSSNPNADISEVSSAFIRVYKDERIKCAEQEVLSSFGLDMQTFDGMLAVNDSVEIADMKREIQNLDFDVAFLVAGFDPNGKPHIFTVSPPGIENHYDPIRFWSIGSGAKAALSSLLFRRLNPVMPFKQAVYHVAEAKFLSESSSGVGRNSLFMSLTPDGSFSMLLQDDIKKLRDLWESEGQPPIPENLDAHVPDFTDQTVITQSTSQGSPSDSDTSGGQP